MKTEVLIWEDASKQDELEMSKEMVGLNKESKKYKRR